MCLIFTAAAAAVSGILYFVSVRRGGRGYASLATAALMYAAALMWCVDGFAAVAAGEPFFDLSADNAALGVVVVAAGAAVLAVLFFLEKRNGKRNRRNPETKIRPE